MIFGTTKKPFKHITHEKQIHQLIVRYYRSPVRRILQAGNAYLDSHGSPASDLHRFEAEASALA